MSVAVHSLRAFNITSLVLFMVCCYYMCVRSEQSPGALTIVETETEDDNGVKIEQEDSDPVYDPSNVFYPEKDWKTVQPGQAIPRGLHVRLNMETGEKEAKLMESDEGNLEYNKNKLKPEDLKEALKNFKTTQHDIPNEKRAEEIKQKFRSYDELKDDFSKMNMGIKTGQEIITDLFEKLKSKNTSILERENLLEELEYHVHQYDNAILLGDLGGIPVLLQGLNDTEANIRSLSAYVIGSAVQNNPKAKISALDAGALQQLIRSLATDSNIAVKKKLLYALSNILRQFPFAQIKFFELGGLQSLMQLFQDDMLTSLQVKVVTLMSDLSLEKTQTLKQQDPNEEKYKQYHQVPLHTSLQDQGFCEIIIPLLKLPDHDSREKVVLSMLNLYDCCQDRFTKSLSFLNKLGDEYSMLSTEEEDGDYFEQIHQNINTLVKQLSQFYHKQEL